METNYNLIPGKLYIITKHVNMFFTDMARESIDLKPNYIVVCLSIEKVKIRGFDTFFKYNFLYKTKKLSFYSSASETLDTFEEI